MPANYGVYSDKRKLSDYENFRSASLYEPQPYYVGCGSGSNVNAGLVPEAFLDSWEVSRLGTYVEKMQDTFAQVTSYGNWNVFGNVLVIDCGQQTEPVVTTKDKLDNIREIYGLSISHLAKVLQTSRPSLHSWLDGSREPRDQSVQRINQIYKFARKWQNQSEFHYPPDRLMRQPLGDGPSMLARLERIHLLDTEIEEGLELLLQLMRRQRIQMDAVKDKNAGVEVSDREQEKTRRQLTPTLYSK